jgi:hypothetical protein
VAELPLCDFCKLDGRTELAHYDFMTTEGVWAFGCTRHYFLHRAHLELGVGKGQRWMLEAS